MKRALGFCLVGILLWMPGAMSSGTPTADASSPQAQLLQEYGEPDAFVIFFQADEAAGAPATRVETWYYAELRTAFDFIDGRFSASEALDPADVPPGRARHRPRDFHAGQTWPTLRQALGIDDFAQLDVDTLKLDLEPLRGATAYATPGLLLVFTPKGLAYVQAIGAQGNGP